MVSANLIDFKDKTDKLLLKNLPKKQVGPGGY